jgi:hypothetical protein
MLSFKNWLATGQGKFFQQQLVEGHKFMADTELEKIYKIFKKNDFDRPPNIKIKECWHLKNHDGSSKIPS